MILKKRSKKKSFILLIDSLDTIAKYIKKLSAEELNFIDTVWPGPTTLLIDYDEKLPEHLQNASGKIALRVSNHYPIKSLLEIFIGIMVSTSANISGQDNLNNIDEIMSVFNESNVAYFDDKLGNNNKPSRIIDLHTRTVIRD